MSRRYRDIVDVPLLVALRTNPRRIGAGDMRDLLREAADKIEELEAQLAALRAELELVSK